MFCINVRVHVHVHTALWRPVCVRVCVYIHTCHMPQLGEGADFIIPCNTCNNSSLFSLSSFKSDNKSMHLYSTHTMYMYRVLCRYPLPYPRYKQDSHRLFGSSSHSLAHSRTPQTMCMHMCIYVFKYVDSVDFV